MFFSRAGRIHDEKGFWGFFHLIVHKKQELAPLTNWLYCVNHISLLVLITATVSRRPEMSVILYILVCVRRIKLVFFSPFTVDEYCILQNLASLQCFSVSGNVTPWLSEQNVQGA